MLLKHDLKKNRAKISFMEVPYVGEKQCMQVYAGFHYFGYAPIWPLQFFYGNLFFWPRLLACTTRDGVCNVIVTTGITRRYMQKKI